LENLQSEAYPEESRYWLERLSPAATGALARVRKANACRQCSRAVALPASLSTTKHS
jgi:hypothetical protein